MNTDPYYVDDMSHLPIIVRTFRRAPTDEEFEAHLNDLQARLEGPGHFGFVFDFGESAIASRPHRKRQADWLKKNRLALEDEPYGNAMVVTHPLHRFVLSSIYLVTDIPGRNSVVGSVEDAICFVAAGMISVGDPVPPSVQRLLAAPMHISTGVTAR